MDKALRTDLLKEDNLVTKFLYSGYFPAVYSLIVFLCWTFEIEVFGLVLTVLAAAFVLAAYKDTTPLLVFIFSAAFMFPKDVDPMTYGPAFFAFIPLVAAIIFHFVYYPVTFKTGKLFWAQSAVSVALILGGLGYASWAGWAKGLPYVLLLGLLILVLYFLLYMHVTPKKNFDISLYIGNALLYAGLVLCAELIVYSFRTEVFSADFEQLKAIAGSAMNVGWGIGNNVATLLLITAPMTFYLSTRSKFPYVYILAGLLQYFCIFLTWSRGGILAAIVTLPAIGVFSVTRCSHKRRLLTGAAVLVVVMLILYLAFRGKMNDIIRAAMSQNYELTAENSSGRLTSLWPEAVECFKNAPIFGVGLGHDGPNYAINNAGFYWFHSTFFQVIANMGLVGLIAYVYYYAKRIGIVWSRRTFNIFFFIANVGFEGYSMMDTGTFVPVPSMLTIILLTMVCEIVNERDPAPIPDGLPLIIDTKAAVAA